MFSVTVKANVLVNLVSPAISVTGARQTIMTLLTKVASECFYIFLIMTCFSQNVSRFS